MSDYIELEKIIKMFLKKQHMAILKIGTVTAVSSPNATVVLDGDSVGITIPNKTNLTLSIGNRVTVVLLGGDYTNAFIGWK